MVGPGVPQQRTLADEWWFGRLSLTMVPPGDGERFTERLLGDRACAGVYLPIVSDVEVTMIQTPLKEHGLLGRYGRTVIVVGALLVSIGCRDNAPQSLEAPSDTALPTTGEQGMLSSALDALKDGASRVQRAVEPYASPIQSTAVESVQKFLAIDYRLIELPLNEPTERIETRLNELGTERWDCTPMPQTATHARFLCKRLPTTAYLKALSLLGKLTPE